MSGSGTDHSIDVKQTLAYRGLKAAVIILGVLIVMALVVLVAGFAYKLGGHGHNAPQATFAPPAGARLISVETSGDRVTLRLRTSSGEEVDIVDATDGRLVARFRFAPSTP